MAAPRVRQTTQHWWQTYRQYLRTPAWQAKRQRVLRRAGHQCEQCHTAQATQVHHVTYVRVRHERLSDLVALCEPCHKRMHRQRKKRTS